MVAASKRFRATESQSHLAAIAAMSRRDAGPTKWATGGSTYDAVHAKNKRSAPTGILRSEDAELTDLDRKKLVSASRTLHRNFSLAAWMIRRHLDYVSTFTFQAKTGNDELDDSLERLVRWWSFPANCDVTGRFSLAKIVRLAEMRRVVDGDMGLLKLSDGRLQPIEGDRIRTAIGGLPEGWNVADFLHGVYTNKAGRPLNYCICKRGDTRAVGGYPSQFTFERIVSARNLYHFGYFDRFDQVRGISPLACAVNTLRDTYEGFDYALAKMKVSQLFGLVFYREAAEEVLPIVEDETEVEDGGNRYKANPAKGPMVLDLDPGDRAEFLESKTPSTEFQAFSETMIGVALKSLDIPYSFYSENFTNYSGARQALLQYELSAKIKRQEVQAMLDSLTAWRISLWIQDGVLSGVDMQDVRWEWVPAGIPWIDPLKEIKADIEAIGAGLTSRQRRCKERGVDFFEIVDELATENDYLASKGVSASALPGNTQIVEVNGNG